MTERNLVSSFTGSAPFRLIPICLTWTKLLLTDVLKASCRNAWRNPDPITLIITLTPTPTLTPILALTPTLSLGLGEMGRHRFTWLIRHCPLSVQLCSYTTTSQAAHWPAVSNEDPNLEPPIGTSVHSKSTKPLIYLHQNWHERLCHPYVWLM